MSAHVAVWGRLIADPEQRTTKTGKPWATAHLAVAMPQPYGADEDADPPTLWLAVTTFGQTAETLARHAKGECLSVAGRLEMRPYTSRDGEPREGWTCIADRVIGPRSPRPRGGRKRSRCGGGQRPAGDAQVSAPGDVPDGGAQFNDDVPL